MTLRDAIFLAGLGLLAIFVLRMVIAARARISGPDARAKVAAGALLVDVRSRAEFAAGALPGAIHIPVGEIAARVAELPAGKPIVVYCASGMRSASAARALRSRGREVHDLGPASAW